MTGPRAGTQPARELFHAVEDFVHLGHDVRAVNHDRCVARRAKRRVQNRALLGDVDLVAAEHRVDAVAKIALVGQCAQEPQRLVGDALFGVVEKQTGRLGVQPLAAFRIVGEQRPQMDVTLFGRDARRVRSTRDASSAAR